VCFYYERGGGTQKDHVVRNSRADLRDADDCFLHRRAKYKPQSYEKLDHLLAKGEKLAFIADWEHRINSIIIFDDPHALH
jgi:hypothetical protein